MHFGVPSCLFSPGTHLASISSLCSTTISSLSYLEFPSHCLFRCPFPVSSIFLSSFRSYKTQTTEDHNSKKPSSKRSLLQLAMGDTKKAAGCNSSAEVASKPVLSPREQEVLMAAWISIKDSEPQVCTLGNMEAREAISCLPQPSDATSRSTTIGLPTSSA